MTTKKTKNDLHKPVIETVINTAALAMAAFGVQQITSGSPKFPFGYLALLVAMGLEFFKYWGRKKQYW